MLHHVDGQYVQRISFFSQRSTVQVSIRNFLAYDSRQSTHGFAAFRTDMGHKHAACDGLVCLGSNQETLHENFRPRTAYQKLEL